MKMCKSGTKGRDRRKGMESAGAPDRLSVEELLQILEVGSSEVRDCLRRGNRSGAIAGGRVLRGTAAVVAERLERGELRTVDKSRNQRKAGL